MKTENQTQHQSTIPIDDGCKSSIEKNTANNDSDCYSDSNMSETVENNLTTVLKFQDDIVRHTTDEFKATLAQCRKELLAAVSEAERSEAIRQSRELELTKVNLINRKLCHTCDQQAEQLTKLQEQIRVANEKSEVVVQNLTTKYEAEINQSLKTKNVLEHQLKNTIERADILQNCLNETQARLDAAVANEEELHSKIDRLTRELSHATEEKLKNTLLMESEMNDATLLKLNHDNLIHEYDNLRDRFEQTEQRLTTLRAGLPTIVRQAVIKAVETVRATAVLQLESANNRLHETETRLEQQLDRLRTLEFNRKLPLNSPNGSSLMVERELKLQATDVTTSSTKPSLKPRSRTMLDRDVEQNEGDVVQNSSEPDHEPALSATKKQSYSRTALNEVNQRTLYKQLCQVIRLLTGDVQTAHAHLQTVEPRNSLTGPNRVRSVSIDKCAPTKLRLRIPAPPWRVPSKQLQAIQPLNVTKLFAVTNQCHKLAKPLKTDEDFVDYENQFSVESKLFDSEGRGEDEDLWVKTEKAINELYKLITLRSGLIGESETSLIQRLKALELENQQLHKKLKQYCEQEKHASAVSKCKSNMDNCSRLSEEESNQVRNLNSAEAEMASGYPLHGRKPRQTCPVQSLPAHKCCRSSERMQALEARCFRALSEAERWQRRWREQEQQLKAERERISIMKINQEADKQIREHFLYSVCKLVQEASHQIEHIVRKTTTSSGSLRPLQPPACHCKSSNADQASHTNARQMRGQQPEPDTQSSEGRSDERILNRSKKLGQLDVPFGLTTAHGDGQRFLVESKHNPTSNVGQLQETNPNAIETFPHTNCNNNEVATSSTSDKRVATQMQNNKFSNESDNNQQISNDVHLRSNYDSSLRDLYLDGSPVPRNNSVISEVRSTSTISDSPSSIPEDDANCAPSVAEHGESIRSSGVDVKEADGALSEASISASSHFVAANGASSENPKRWNELREAVRYELSRVLANVISQAKEDNSIAQECLQAIADLQAQLETESTVLLSQTEPVSAAVTTQQRPQKQTMVAAAGESKRHALLSVPSRTVTASHRLSHLSNLNGVRTQTTTFQVGETTAPVMSHAAKLARNITNHPDHPKRPHPITGTLRSGASAHPRLTRTSVPNTDGATDTLNPGLERKRPERGIERPRWRPVGTCVQNVSRETTTKVNRLHTAVTHPSKPTGTGKKDQSQKLTNINDTQTNEQMTTVTISNSDDTQNQTNSNSIDIYSNLKEYDALTGLSSHFQSDLTKPNSDSEGDDKDMHDESSPDQSLRNQTFVMNDNLRCPRPRGSISSVNRQRNSVQPVRSGLVKEECQDPLSNKDFPQSIIRTHRITRSPQPMDNTEQNTNTGTTNTTMFVAVDSDSDHSKSHSDSNNSSTAPVLWVAGVDHNVLGMNSFIGLAELEPSEACCCGTACCTIDADGL